MVLGFEIRGTRQSSIQLLGAQDRFQARRFEAIALVQTY